MKVFPDQERSVSCYHRHWGETSGWGEREFRKRLRASQWSAGRTLNMTTLVLAPGRLFRVKELFRVILHLSGKSNGEKAKADDSSIQS